MDPRLIVDDPAPGSWNMAVDEALFQVGQASRQPAIRLYQWSEPTLSLGYFQLFEDRWQHPGSVNCPLVRRSTGGGAILHDHELTYSLVLPIEEDRAASSDLVRAVHQSLIDALASIGVDACFAPESSAASNPQSQPFLCFQRCSPNDVFVSGSKIAGSAQRKLHRTLLQHGSILLRRSDAAPELPGICDLTRLAISPTDLIDVLTQRLTQAVDPNSDYFRMLEISRVSGGNPPAAISHLSDDEQALAAQIDTEKFRSDQWNKKR